MNLYSLVKSSLLDSLLFYSICFDSIFDRPHVDFKNVAKLFENVIDHMNQCPILNNNAKVNKGNLIKQWLLILLNVVDINPHEQPNQ